MRSASRPERSLGAITGYSALTRRLLDPTLQALRSIPSIAWVPLFILWLGIFESSKITLIAVGVFFPVYLGVMGAVLSVDRKIVEVGRVFRLSGAQMVRRILLPAVLPAYVIALRSGLGLGWMFVVAAELLGASEGLGYLLVDGQQLGKPAQIVAAIVVFAVIGKTTDWLLERGGRAVPALGRSLRSEIMTLNISSRRKDLRQPGARARRHLARRRAGRDRRGGRRLGLRQVDACCGSSPASTIRRQGNVALDGDAIVSPHEKIGIVFQEPRLLPWLTVARQCRLRPRRPAEGRTRRARRAPARPRRPHRQGERVAARIVRRTGAARRDRARAGDAARGAAAR